LSFLGKLPEFGDLFLKRVRIKRGKFKGYVGSLKKMLDGCGGER